MKVAVKRCTHQSFRHFPYTDLDQGVDEKCFTKAREYNEDMYSTTRHNLQLRMCQQLVRGAEFVVSFLKY